MLDTNVFNRLVDGKLSANAFQDRRLFATHIQMDELRKTADPERRKGLMEIFEEVNPEVAPTSSFVLDVSRLDCAEIGAESILYKKMLSRLKVLDNAVGKKSKGCNQENDVLIAETAIKCGFALITEDENLADVAKEFSGRSMDLTTFLRVRSHVS